MRERPPPSVAGTAAVVAAAGLAGTGGPRDKGRFTVKTWDTHI